MGRTVDLQGDCEPFLLQLRNFVHLAAMMCTTFLLLLLPLSERDPVAVGPVQAIADLLQHPQFLYLDSELEVVLDG